MLNVDEIGDYGALSGHDSVSTRPRLHRGLSPYVPFGTWLNSFLTSDRDGPGYIRSQSESVLISLFFARGRRLFEKSCVRDSKGIPS